MFPGAMEAVDLYGDPGCAWIAFSHAGWDVIINAYHAEHRMEVIDAVSGRVVFKYENGDDDDEIIRMLLRLHRISGSLPRSIR